MGLWQLLLMVRHWRHPERQIVAVADRTYASLKLLDRCRRLSNPITFVTRLRLDAALYVPAAPPRRAGQRAGLGSTGNDCQTFRCSHKTRTHYLDVPITVAQQ